MSKPLKEAMQILKSIKIKEEAENIISQYTDIIQDIILIFINPEDVVEAYWMNITPNKMGKVFDAVLKKVEEGEVERSALGRRDIL